MEGGAPLSGSFSSFGRYNIDMSRVLAFPHANYLIVRCIAALFLFFALIAVGCTRDEIHICALQKILWNVLT